MKDKDTERDRDEGRHRQRSKGSREREPREYGDRGSIREQPDGRRAQTQQGSYAGSRVSQVMHSCTLKLCTICQVQCFATAVDLDHCLKLSNFTCHLRQPSQVQFLLVDQQSLCLPYSSSRLASLLHAGC